MSRYRHEIFRGGMRRSARLIVFAAGLGTLGAGQATSSKATPPQVRSGIPVNYDEAKVGNYTLPDPLVMENGKRVRDAATWYKTRRPEIVRLFETNVYGRSPDAPKKPSFEPIDLDKSALGGKAIRKQIAVYFDGAKAGRKETLLLYLPAGAGKPVPVILSLNFSGNQTVIKDPGIKLGDVWDSRQKTKHPATDASRGSSKDWQVEETLSRGYGFGTIYYGDIEPDFAGSVTYGIRPLFFQPGQTEPAADQWGAIAAWGWGLSRAMDYLETDKDVDAKRVAIMGHSRLGKTALWAGARDTRFAMVLASCSGEGGASLARRNYGETVKHLNLNFPHWFCANFRKYDDHVDQMPVDTHELIALIAPRPVYVTGAEDDQWADPKGEFLAAVAAGPVYRLLGRQGLETDQMPALNTPIMHTIGYHYRTGKHEVTAFDWDQFLKFADMHFGGQRQ